VKVGDLVRLGDSWAEEDRVLVGIITKIYAHQDRPCCDIFFAGSGDLRWCLQEQLEVINESR